MPYTTLHPNVRDQGCRFTADSTSTAFSDPSCCTRLPSWTASESAVDFSSSDWDPASSECTLSQSEATAAGCSRSLANAEEHQSHLECYLPICTEDICDGCFAQEECGDDCHVDCGSDCGFDFDCDELDNNLDGTYTLGGHYAAPELFGDQTAQTFGLGRSLPRLETDNAMNESIRLGKIPDETMLSASSIYSLPQSYQGSLAQPNCVSQNPWTPHPLNSPQTTNPSRSIYRSNYHGPEYNTQKPASVPTLTPNSASLTYSSDSTHDGTEQGFDTTHAHYDHVSLLTESNDSTGPSLPPVKCQWASSDGRPCGEVFASGNDMHEHLKTAHGVRSEVFCHWIGCSVGALESSPHRFASNVERHTWGHSGYRPYKCSACNEGFAAASVRDEHFTNIHLRKKVFACDKCSHQCTSATNLKRHKDDKHGVERFQCEFCNRNGRRRLFPRGPNLARHFRNCKFVMGQFPEAIADGKVKADWLPPGYRRGHHGMDRAKVTPPDYLPQSGT